jgi:hypothetical protein
MSLESFNGKPTLMPIRENQTMVMEWAAGRPGQILGSLSYFWLTVVGSIHKLMPESNQFRVVD